jgi:hypothetical protein
MHINLYQRHAIMFQPASFFTHHSTKKVRRTYGMISGCKAIRALRFLNKLCGGLSFWIARGQWGERQKTIGYVSI